MSVWIFGYGSLIWRPDFPYLERHRARLHGWERRFWQGSHDHRGVPERPGRVVTLVPREGGHCDGMAYQVDLATARHTFDALDHREKNGYEQREVVLELLKDSSGVGAVSRPRTCAREHAACARQSAPIRSDRALESAPTGGIPAVVYIATTDNHAFLGPAPLLDMARQIATSIGPSGSNRDYLLELATALRRLDAHDPHVFELEQAVRGAAS